MGSAAYIRAVNFTEMKTYQIIIDGTICAWGYSKQYVRNLLAQYKNQHVDVRISSYGGDLAHGLDIRQQFKDHGDVTVYITGFVASSATIIAMGAKRVCMSKYAMFLVHKCSNFIDAWGNYNADQMQRLIEDLEKNKKENDRIDVVIAQLYSEKTGKSINELLSLLKEERWMTAQEALEWGFVDELTEDVTDGKLALTPELRLKLNAFGLPVNGLETEVPRSKLSRALDALKSIFNSPEDDPEADTAVEEPPVSYEPISTTAFTADLRTENQSSTSNEMNTITTYSALMAAIAVSSLEADAEGRVTLTSAQLKAVNDRLAALQGDVTERDNKITALTDQVENLKKLPGDETQEKLDDTSGKGEMSSEEMFKLSDQFLDI